MQILGRTDSSCRGTPVVVEDGCVQFFSRAKLLRKIDYANDTNSYIY